MIKKRKPRQASPAATPVIWVDADELKLLGHGVEFRHDGVPARTVAFADGFDWLHHPGTPVRIRILSVAPPGLAPERWLKISAEVREFIEAYFSDVGRQLEMRLGPVRAWING